MTEEQAEEFIVEQINNLRNQTTNPEELREAINNNLNPHGWNIKSIRTMNGGFSFNVQPSQPSQHNPVSSVQPSAQQSKGVFCKVCKEYNPWCDTPNQPDGTHVCYRCRS